MTSRCLVQPEPVPRAPHPWSPGQTQATPHLELQRQTAGGNQAANRLVAANRQRQSPRQATLPQSFLLGASPVQAKPAFQGLSQELAPQLPTTGKHLPDAVRQKMEASFNADFSTVRIHEGSEAEKIGAIAYTRGSHIHFAPGQYNPTSRSGQELLGHELVHVMQQRANRVALPVARSSLINSDFQLEYEADRLGRQAAQGDVVSLPEVHQNDFNTALTPAAIAPIQCMTEKTKNFLHIGAAYKGRKITKEYKKIKSLIDQEGFRQNPDRKKIEGWNKKLSKLKAKGQKIGTPKRLRAELKEGLAAIDQEEKEIKEFISRNNIKFTEKTNTSRDKNPYPGYVSLKSEPNKTLDSPYGVRIPAPDPEMSSSLSSGYISIRDLGSGYVSARSISTGYDLLPDSVNSYDPLPDSVNLNETQEIDSKHLSKADLISRDASDDNLAWLSDEQLSKLSQLSKYKFLKQVDTRYKDEERGASWLASLSDEQLKNLGIPRDKISELRVLYKKGIQRNEYELSFENSKIYQRGKPFDTTQSTKASSGEQAAIFTMNRNGKIYAGVQQAGQFHHSSFLAAAAAAGAGEISVKQGVLKKITNQSGHYLPGKEQVVQVLQELRENGVSLVGVKLKFLTKDLKGLPTIGFEGLAQKWLDDQKSWLKEGSWLEAGTYKKIVEGDVDPQKDEIEALGFLWNDTEKCWKYASHPDLNVSKGQLGKIRKVVELGGSKKLREHSAVWNDDKKIWQTPKEKIELDVSLQRKILKGTLNISTMDQERGRENVQRKEQAELFESLTGKNINETDNAALEKAGLRWEQDYNSWETPGQVQVRLNELQHLILVNLLLKGEIEMEKLEEQTGFI